MCPFLLEKHLGRSLSDSSFHLCRRHSVDRHSCTTLSKEQEPVPQEAPPMEEPLKETPAWAGAVSQNQVAALVFTSLNESPKCSLLGS